MRHIDLFSGIGGFALAAQWTWGDEYANVGHSEVEPYPCKVYHRHFPESECLGDITKIEWKEGQADIITGGFPCQPHSVAGKRKGSGDERDLWGECVRALRGIRPSYALFENVPGLLTSERGRFFNRLLADMAASGYDAEWQIVSAAGIGATHERARVWIAAYPNSERRERRGEVLHKEKLANIKVEVSTSWDDLRNPFKNWEKLVPAPMVCGKDDGVPTYMVKRDLRALGNSIVPQVAQVIFEAIKQSENETTLP